VGRETPSDAPTPPPWRRALPRLILRALVFVVFLLAVNALVHAMMAWIETLPEAEQTSMRLWVFAGLLLLYAALIAVPFVPGIELGLALIMMEGAAIAPFVYVATVMGLMLAFCIGRFVPLTALSQLFLDLHMTRLYAWIARLAPLEQEARLTLLRESLPHWARVVAVDYRYVSLALLINLPGSMALGGGGGLTMAAGISRLFRAPATVLTIALAVAPVPMLVLLSGHQGLSGWMSW
jgi:hypothetical protein